MILQQGKIPTKKSLLKKQWSLPTITSISFCFRGWKPFYNALCQCGKPFLSPFGLQGTFWTNIYFPKKKFTSEKILTIKLRQNIQKVAGFVLKMKNLTFFQFIIDIKTFWFHCSNKILNLVAELPSQGLLIEIRIYSGTAPLLFLEKNVWKGAFRWIPLI